MTTLSEHLRKAVNVRWSKTTKEERSQVGHMLAAARAKKRAARKAVTDTHTVPESGA